MNINHEVQLITNITWGDTAVVPIIWDENDIASIDPTWLKEHNHQ